MRVFHLPFQYSSMLKMRVSSVKSKNNHHFTDLLTPFFTAHLGHFGPCHGRGTINICTKTVVARMEIASAGVVGHNPEIARRKPSDFLMVPYVVRLSWMPVSKVKLRLTILKINRAIVIFILGEGFHYSKSVISTTQLARLNGKSIYCPPVAWGKYDQVSRKSTSEFPNKTLVLVGGLVSKQKLQKMFFFRYSVDGKKIAPVDMVNILSSTGFHTCQEVQGFFHQQYE